MAVRPVWWTWLAVIPAIALLWVWLRADHVHHTTQHRAEFEQRGAALLGAAEAAVVREARGGAYLPEELERALDDVRERVGASWIRVEDAAGATLAVAGEPSRAAQDRRVFEATLEVPRPRGSGPRRGRPWRDQTGLTELPEGELRLALALPTGPLDERVASDRERLLLVGGGLSLGLVALGLVLTLALRSASLAAGLEASRERLAGLEYVRRLGAGLAHETRNPLGAVRGLAEALARDAGDDETRRSAATIVRETDRTLARLDEFQLLSRPRELQREAVELGPLLRELGELLGPELGAKDASLELDVAPLTLAADREQLRRLLFNLLLNAAQAVGPGGHVRVAARADGAGARLAVTDDGPGVPEALRDTLFEPYVSARPGGTGLGLSIARRICEAHGWRLRCGAPARGAELVVEVPEA